MPTDEMKLLLERAQTVVDKFEADEAQGYHTKDRAYAIEMLRPALDAVTRPSTPPDVVEAARMFADRVDELADKVRPPSAAACELHMAVIQFRAAIAALSASGGQSGMVERAFIAGASEALDGRLSGVVLPEAARDYAARADANTLDATAAAIQSQAKEIERLREALEPFADYAADPQQNVPAHLNITRGSWMAKRQLTMGDCYTARTALEGKG